MSNAAISRRNASNTSFYDNHERRSSLLCHPIGVEMLRCYFKLKERGLDDQNDTEFQKKHQKSLGNHKLDIDQKLRDKIAEALLPVLYQHEPKISSAVVKAINENWIQAGSARGEGEEKVEGQLRNYHASGRPDGVVRLAYVEDKDETLPPDEALPPQLIIEFSVDNNGGEKKIGQACDYASLAKGIKKTVMLFTFHVVRNKDGGELKVAQEAFLYVHNEHEEERKVAFLWREIYVKEQEEEEKAFVKRSCEGLVRCINCVPEHRDKQVIHEDTNWKQVSDNVAIYDHVVEKDGEKPEIKVVSKIFDNRFHPTYRRPYQWKENLPWVQKLDAKMEIFQESDSIDPLGYPSNYAPNPHSRKRKKGLVSHTQYPRGSVCIITYKFVNGTHYASRASHFLDIAKSIEAMHKEGVVHGDIRGFNMLHPHPDAGIGKKESVLIDFDLSGKAEEDKYPPGYSESVKDNAHDRSGVAGNVMMKSDDWKDLGAVIACYELVEGNIDKIEDYFASRAREKEWTKIYRAFYEDGNTNNVGYNLLENFVENHRDPAIKMNVVRENNFGSDSFRGTGSPNKHLQGPRGSCSLTVSTVT